MKKKFEIMEMTDVPPRKRASEQGTLIDGIKKALENGKAVRIPAESLTGTTLERKRATFTASFRDRSMKVSSRIDREGNAIWIWKKAQKD